MSVINKAVSFKTQNPVFYPVQAQVPALDRFHKMVQRDLVTLSTKMDNNQKHNLSNTERSALKVLKHNDDLNLCNADKGGSIVLLNAGL